MAIEPVTYISINLGPQAGVDDFLAGIRVVPAGRESGQWYGRTLNEGEMDSGEGIPIKPGDTLTFQAGSISVTMADVDRYAEPGSDGYARVANTVWTWLAIPPRQYDQTFVNYLLAAARRLDAAHTHCAATLAFLDNPPDEKGFMAREAMFDALGHAESMCIALGRAVRMIGLARQTISTSVPVPPQVGKVEEAVIHIRNAFEHIDERAIGKARNENSEDAMSVFDQSDYFLSGILRYAGYSLDVRAEVLSALIAGRQFIVNAATHAGLRKTINEPIEWTFTDDAP